MPSHVVEADLRSGCLNYVRQLVEWRRSEHVTRPPFLTESASTSLRSDSRCPFPSNLRYRAALFAGVLQVGGTESGRVCPIQLRQITAILAVECVESAGQSVR